MAKGKSRLRRVLKVTTGLLALVCAIVAIDYWDYPYCAAISGPSRNSGENGLWLRYTWYFGEHTTTDRHQLAQRLLSKQIRYAYFHVRSIGNEGMLEHRYADRARTLTAGLRHECPGVILIAWAYVPTDTTRAVSLSDSKTRKAMVSEALWLVRNCGFDGVQWDVEPCPDGDSGFLDLLKESRAAMPHGKILSVASPMWEPGPLRGYGWSDSYFSQVARSCDQVAVMCYDSGFYMPRAYVWLVSQQAIHVTSAVGNPKCRVLLGVPTYSAGLRSHNPRAENLSNALRGVDDGLADPRSHVTAFAGVAMFADYTTTAKDWDVYEKLWLTK